MLHPMRLFRGARTAPLQSVHRVYRVHLGLAGTIAVRSSLSRMLSMALVALVAIEVSAGEAHGQAVPKSGTREAVLDAPPPTPELTELDERQAGERADDDAAPPATAPDKKKAQSSAPAAVQNSAPAAVQNGAPAVVQNGVPTPPSSPKAISADSAAPAPRAAAQPAAPAAQDGPQPSASPPPPPAVDGDFAGSGAADAKLASAPQEDFAAEVQEYSRTERREYSVRVDLLNWLLLGRLSLELEAGLWRFLSVQITPVFVVAHSPIAINYAGLDDPLTQHSNGIAALSGISLGLGAWVWGKPFKGYVLRLEFTNYGYSYRAADADGQIDRVDFTERRAILFIGSHSRFGAFTFAGGFGLGYELNQAERCGLSYASGSVSAREDDCRGRQQIALDRGIEDRADLNGPLHPVYFQARFSIGAVF